MNHQLRLHHIGLQCSDINKARIFYQDVLGLALKKTFVLSRELSNKIFDLYIPIDVLVFQNDALSIEVFIVPKHIKNKTTAHNCIIVPDVKEFINHCQSKNVESFSVKKGEKCLWFIKDFSGNLFELKEGKE